VVNKADGELAGAAQHAAAEYMRALQLVRCKHAAWQPPVVRVSAATGAGVSELWVMACEFRHALSGVDGPLVSRRRAQSAEWMWGDATSQLVGLLRDSPAVGDAAAAMSGALSRGVLTPRRAASALVQRLLAEVASGAAVGGRG
jgi:LAO/AO transport system kinase